MFLFDASVSVDKFYFQTSLEFAKELLTVIGASKRYRRPVHFETAFWVFREQNFGVYKFYPKVKKKIKKTLGFHHATVIQ